MGRPRIAPEERTCVVCGETFLKPRHRHEQSCSKRCGGIASGLTKNALYGEGWNSGANNSRYNNGLCRTKEGRTVITCRDGTLVFYYRALMEAHIGRPLVPEELIHHIDHDESNDELENLMIVTRSEHIEIHRHDLIPAKEAA